MKEIGLIFPFLCAFYSFPEVSGQALHCYECSAESGCTNPLSSVPSDNCYEQLGDYTAGVSVTCFSAFLNYSGVSDLAGNPRDTETGVFRNCGIIPERLGDYCEWYKIELGLVGIQVVSCEWCKTDKCNTHLFDLETGLIIEHANNGSKIIFASLFSLILCGFLMIICK